MSLKCLLRYFYLFWAQGLSLCCTWAGHEGVKEIVQFLQCANAVAFGCLDTLSFPKSYCTMDNQQKDRYIHADTNMLLDIFLSWLLTVAADTPPQNKQTNKHKKPIDLYWLWIHKIKGNRCPSSKYLWRILVNYFRLKWTALRNTFFSSERRLRRLNQVSAFPVKRLCRLHHYFLKKNTDVL